MEAKNGSLRSYPHRSVKRSILKILGIRKESAVGQAVPPAAFIPPVQPYGYRETWWPLILALAFIGLVALTAVGMARAWGMGAASVDPNITIAVYAPPEGMAAYTVTYDCEQHDDTALLLPELQTAVAATLKAVGPSWGVFETKRGLCRQTKLMHRAVSGRMDSKHLIGAAVDFVCWSKTGKASWDCPWETLGKACRAQGLIWGGDFPTLNDPGHCELPPLQPLP